MSPLSSTLRQISSCTALFVALAAQAQTVSVAELREDLATFRSAFLDRDVAFGPAARAEAQQRLDRLLARETPIEVQALAIELSRIAALADNGHTWVFASRRIDTSNRVPVRLAPFGTAFHVMRAPPDDTELLGATLEAIDDVPLARLRAAAHELVGGPAPWRNRQAPFLFESPQQLHTIGLAAAPGEARYRFRLGDGRSVERRLAGVPPGPDRPRAETARLLLPEVTPDGPAWRGALPLERAPWALRDATQRMRWRHAPELAALVVDLRVTHDTGSQKLRDFFAEVDAAWARHQPTHVVLDLRQNGGGDLTKARDFAESLVSRASGQVFVLTSPATFSAAISLTGYMKQAAPQRVRIVGETAGDRLAFFAEGRTVTLARSGIAALPATERHDYADGCRAFRDCHAPVVQRPIRVATLEPDIAAPWTWADYAAGTDPAMDAVARALAGARPGTARD